LAPEKVSVAYLSGKCRNRWHIDGRRIGAGEDVWLGKSAAACKEEVIGWSGLRHFFFIQDLAGAGSGVGGGGLL